MRRPARNWHHIALDFDGPPTLSGLSKDMSVQPSTTGATSDISEDPSSSDEDIPPLPAAEWGTVRVIGTTPYTTIIRSI